MKIKVEIHKLINIKNMMRSTMLKLKIILICRGRIKEELKINLLKTNKIRVKKIKKMIKMKRYKMVIIHKITQSKAILLNLNLKRINYITDLQLILTVKNLF